MRTSALAKALFAAFLVAALVIPLQMIRSLVDERQRRREEAIAEVSDKWGAAQTLAGPVLTVPYRVRYVDKDGIQRVGHERVQLLPDRLTVGGTLRPSVRHRGIFDVVLYGTSLDVRGTFPAFDGSSAGVGAEEVLWNEAVLSFGITDTRGIRGDVKLQWDGAGIPFRPSAGGNPVLASGIHAPIPADGAAGAHTFALSLTLQGSQTFVIAPLGVETQVTLRSPWPDPSFTGAFLPESRTVGRSGFDATWRVSHFGRNYPQQWKLSGLDVEEMRGRIQRSTFGVALFQPADHYQQSTRSLKYAVLFIVLTFGAFFLFEVGSALELHPLQYLLVGLALSLFYLLLLSISEHAGFALAYAVSAAATVLLITGYCARILERRRRAAAIGGLLAALYAYLFVLLRVEDYALLMGSIALFLVLAVVMYLTRGVDWYSISSRKPQTPPIPPRQPIGSVPPIFSSSR